MEDYNNGQQNNIVSGLDNETVNALKSIQRNFNDEFMNGASTSGFRKYQESKDKSDLASTGDNLSGIANGVANASQIIDSIITPKLITYVTSYVTSIVSTYLSDAVQEMLSFSPGMITSMAGGLIQNYLINPSQIMGELLKTREEMNDEMIANTQKELINDINEQIGNSVGKVTDEINKKLEDINPTIAEISYYAQMGPDWVQNKMNLATQKIVENCLKGIGKARDDLNEQKTNMINNLADGIAKQKAGEVNEKIKREQKEKIDKVNKAKQEALNKVKTQLINVKLKLFALIGA